MGAPGDEDDRRLRLEVWIHWLEYYSSQIGTDPRVAQIEELASELDANKASWLRERTSADYIRDTALRCRRFMDAGLIGKVDKIRSSFESDRSYIIKQLDQQEAERNRQEAEHNRQDAERGRKVIQSAKEGHRAMHGDDAEKIARWQRIQDDYQAESARGTKKAAKLVAHRYGVSERQVYRSKHYLSKID